MTRSEMPSFLACRRGPKRKGDGGGTIVWLRGEHDIATKKSVMESIARVTQREITDVVVDLSGVTYMDASTIGALVECRNRLLTQSHSLLVRAPSSPATRVLELCGLADLVQPASTAAVLPPAAGAALGPDLLSSPASW